MSKPYAFIRKDEDGREYQFLAEVQGAYVTTYQYPDGDEIDEKGIIENGGQFLTAEEVGWFLADTGCGKVTQKES